MIVRSKYTFHSPISKSIQNEPLFSLHDAPSPWKYFWVRLQQNISLLLCSAISQKEQSNSDNFRDLVSRSTRLMCQVTNLKIGSTILLVPSAIIPCTSLFTHISFNSDVSSIFENFTCFPFTKFSLLLVGKWNSALNEMVDTPWQTFQTPISFFSFGCNILGRLMPSGAF